MAVTGQMSKLARWLNLIPYLRRHPGIDVATAARELGVSPARLRADLGAVMYCGLPGLYPGDLIEIDFDDTGIDISFTADLDTALKLTGQEASALLLALRALADSPGVTDPSATLRAIAKIEVAVTGAGRGTVASIDGVEDPAAVAKGDTVHSALRWHHALRLRYYSATGDQVTDRIVDPIRVDVFGGHTYLQAWCRRSAGVRLFRFDRIDTADELDEPASIPENVLPEESLFASAEVAGLTTARLRLSPRAVWALEYHPLTVERTDGAAGTVATMRYATEDWMVRFVLGFGGEAVALHPPELAAAVADRARAGLANYS